MDIMRREKLIQKENLAILLHDTVNANIETVFRTLRKLAEAGKITPLAGGFYRYKLKDDKTGSLTKWIS